MYAKNITYVEGDLFKPVSELKGQTVLIPHVCNNVGAWGAGFVVPLGRVYPKAKEVYLKWYKGTMVPESTYPGGMDFGLGATQVVQVSDDPRVIVFNMVAQQGLGADRPLRYNALARCMDHVAEEWRKYPSAAVHAPLFGAGLAGGKWEFIEQLVLDCWLRRGINVCIYYLPGTLPVGWNPEKGDLK